MGYIVTRPGGVNIEDLVVYRTGLTLEQLVHVGYCVMDADTKRLWVDVPPAALGQTAVRSGHESEISALAG